MFPNNTKWIYSQLKFSQSPPKVTEEKLGGDSGLNQLHKKSYFSKYYKIYGLEKVYDLGRGSCKSKALTVRIISFSEHLPLVAELTMRLRHNILRSAGFSHTLGVCEGGGWLTALLGSTFLWCLSTPNPPVKAQEGQQARPVARAQWIWPPRLDFLAGDIIIHKPNCSPSWAFSWFNVPS